MKKILAVLLAAMLVMSMSIMAFAAETATVKTQPTKTKYKVDEAIDLAGLVLKCGEKEVTYAKDDANFSFSPEKMAEATKSVTVKYVLKEEGKDDVEYTASINVTLDKPAETTTAAPAGPKIVVSKATTQYNVGDTFDGILEVSYIPEGSKIATETAKLSNGDDIGYVGFNTAKASDKVTVKVTYKGLETTYDIVVIDKPEETTNRLDKQTIVKDLWAAKSDLDASGACLEDYVARYTSIISTYMAADDLDDIAKYVDTQDKVQELVQDSSLYPDNWNEFVKIYTDYIPTAVNQQLDIAARLGWDASDQDFVQDIIDLVKGAAESDKAPEKAADNGGNGGSTATDANPKTGSASAIAVFAVLSVAAAAVVCTKKKED